MIDCEKKSKWRSLLIVWVPYNLKRVWIGSSCIHLIIFKENILAKNFEWVIYVLLILNGTFLKLIIFLCWKVLWICAYKTLICRYKDFVCGETIFPIFYYQVNLIFNSLQFLAIYFIRTFYYFLFIQLKIFTLQFYDYYK